jgi:two-component system phosphate regulon sensor histidine kinase PhoR
MATLSQKKKVEQQLLMAEIAIRESHSALALTDIYGILTYVNQAFLKVWDYMETKEVLGKSLADLSKEKEKFQKVVDDLRAGSNIESAELTGIKTDGTEFIIGLRASRVVADSGKLIGITISLADITQRKQFEEKQRELEKIRTEFISNVSHELRTPLQSIKGFTKLMLEGKVPDQDTQKEFLGIMYNQSTYLQRLTESLLDVFRIESGRFSIRKKTVHLGNIIRTAVESVGGLTAQNNMTVVEDIPSELLEIDGDEERLMQVTVNLLSNAIKFSPEGSVITVKVESTTDYLVVHVIDQGVGIAEEAVSRLFQRFYQVESSAKRDVGGSGLGLYISKQIVEAHGGHIWVESKVDKGSVFSFNLPSRLTP